MAVYSQNGYKACDASLIAKYTVPTTKITINLRKGDVSVVALDFLSWYHKNIEPLQQKDTGGYNCRTIAGSKVKSNHASGTAWDVRWQDHVQGKRNAGFSAAEVAEINKKLAEYGGVIRWGNNYSGTPDAMHFEINENAAAVKVQADRIRKRNATPAKPKPPAKPAAVPTFKNGSRQNSASKNSTGSDVATLQRFIGPAQAGPADGRWDSKTTAGVKWYQREILGFTGKNVDGIAGPKTWAPILKAIK